MSRLLARWRADNLSSELPNMTVAKNGDDLVRTSDANDDAGAGTKPSTTLKSLGDPSYICTFCAAEF